MEWRRAVGRRSTIIISGTVMEGSEAAKE